MIYDLTALKEANGQSKLPSLIALYQQQIKVLTETVTYQQQLLDLYANRTANFAEILEVQPQEPNVNDSKQEQKDVEEWLEKIELSLAILKESKI